MTFNVKEIAFKNIEGNPLIIPDINKTIGDLLFQKAISIPIHDLARKVYYNEPAELTKDNLVEVLQIVSDSSLYMFVKKPIIDYISELINKSDSPSSATKPKSRITKKGK